MHLDEKWDQLIADLQKLQKLNIKFHEFGYEIKNLIKKMQVKISDKIYLKELFIVNDIVDILYLIDLMKITNKRIYTLTEKSRFKVLVFITLFVLVWAKRELKRKPVKDKKISFYPDAHWSTLQNPISVEEAERQNMVKDDRLGPESVPFGFINSRWAMLKSKMRKCDQLWTFRSPESDWRLWCGREGIVLVRKNIIIVGITTAEN